MSISSIAIGSYFSAGKYLYCKVGSHKVMRVGTREIYRCHPAATYNIQAL
jgi:hypothetical protein